MKILKIITCFFVFSIMFLSSACSNDIGGLQINKLSVINDTIFDTKDLQLIMSETKREINYSVKIIGKTKPLDDKQWSQWFNNEEHDLAGKIAVCLQLDYSQEIANDPNATLSTIVYSDNTILSTRKLTDISNTRIDENSIYIVLNPIHDVILLKLDYLSNKENRSIIYSVDMININSDSSRLE